MVFYAEDRLTESISELETAYNLEPGNQIVARNLSRSLQFQVALLKENREYERAIAHLNRLREISRPEENQKIQFMIEEVEDRIYEQVQNANTVDKYQWYLKHYPAGINAEKARRKLAELQDQQSSRVQSFEDRQELDSSGVLQATPEQAEGEMPITEENVQAVAPITEEPVTEETISEQPVFEEPVQEESVSDTLQEAPPHTQEDLANEEAPVIKGEPADTTPVEPSEATEVEPAPSAQTQTPAEPANILITLNNPESSLRIRAAPNTKSPVLAGIKHGQIRPLKEENEHWFKIEYEPGKTGWISKKFSRKLQPGTKNSQPQAHFAPVKRVSG